MFLLIYYIHPRRNLLLVQLFFFAVSVAAGCWLVRSVNEAGYYAVVKRAPQVGTLWIWSAVEMSLLPILVSCVIVGGYTWWNGFSFV
jgi:hypothetical protein